MKYPYQEPHIQKIDLLIRFFRNICIFYLGLLILQNREQLTNPKNKLLEIEAFYRC